MKDEGRKRKVGTNWVDIEEVVKKVVVEVLKNKR